MSSTRMPQLPFINLILQKISTTITESLKAAIAAKELEKAALLQRVEARRQNQHDGEDHE
jgi:hypothetical protein